MKDRFGKLSARSMAVLVLAVAGCSGEPTAPGRDPEIINNTDNFQYQISDIVGFSGNQVYTWQNTGARATVNQSASIAAGSVTLQVTDAAGVAVYNRSLADNGTFTSTTGTPGAWTVRVVYASASATVNFRLDKAN